MRRNVCQVRGPEEERRVPLKQQVAESKASVIERVSDCQGNSPQTQASTLAAEEEEK